MEIEERIRTRIEAILVNDARNFSEIKNMASDDEPLEAEDILADERNLYHRIINSYRSAVGEVNKLLEESIGSISARTIAACCFPKIRKHYTWKEYGRTANS